MKEKGQHDQPRGWVAAGQLGKRTSTIQGLEVGERRIQDLLFMRKAGEPGITARIFSVPGSATSRQRSLPRDICAEIHGRCDANSGSCVRCVSVGLKTGYPMRRTMRGMHIPEHEWLITLEVACHASVPAVE
eukprot:3463017-Rhodomonas_salina.1